MTSVRLIFEEDQDAKRLEGREIIHLGNDAPPLEIVPLPKGMSSGKTSVSLIFLLPDNKAVIAETSLRLLSTAVDAIKAKFPGTW